MIAEFHNVPSLEATGAEALLGEELWRHADKQQFLDGAIRLRHFDDHCAMRRAPVKLLYNAFAKFLPRHIIGGEGVMREHGRDERG